MSIVLLESVHEEARALLEAFDRVLLAEAPEELNAVVRKEQVVAILTRGRGRVTRHLMEQSPSLQVIARCGVGLDNIDLAAANERRVPVVYAPNSTTTTVAEHTFMLILAAARRLCPIVGEVRAGNWGVRDGYQGVELAGKTVGIVGMGAIGSRVAALAEAFGMRVTYWSPSSRSERYEFVPFESLLREADIVTLHVALNGGTHHLIGARELALMKPGAVLVNTARGAIVAQPALAEALTAGRLAGYATDVLEQEPPGADEALLQSDRVLVTPHVAALTDATYRRMCVRTAANVLAILRDEPPEVQAVYNRHLFNWPTPNT